MLAATYDDMVGLLQMHKGNLEEWNLQRFEESYDQTIQKLQQLIEELQVAQ